MGSPTREETKQRRARLTRELFRLTEKLGIPDHELAKRMNVSPVTVMQYRIGKPPKNVHRLGELVAELRERAKEPGPAANGKDHDEILPPVILPTPILPITSPNEAVLTGLEWRRGYQAGFKDGVEYANQLTLGLVKEELRHGKE